MLLREPVLQDRRAEHVKFQKQAHELMERVSVVSVLFQCSYFSSQEKVFVSDSYTFVLGERARQEEELR